MTVKEIVEEHMKAVKEWRKEVLASPAKRRQFLINIGALDPKTNKAPRRKRK